MITAQHGQVNQQSQSQGGAAGASVQSCSESWLLGAPVLPPPLSSAVLPCQPPSLAPPSLAPLSLAPSLQSSHDLTVLIAEVVAQTLALQENLP